MLLVCGFVHLFFETAETIFLHKLVQSFLLCVLKHSLVVVLKLLFSSY